MSTTAIDQVEWLGRIDFAEGLEIQEEAVGEALAGNPRNRLLLLEHNPVYTIGRTRDASSLGDTRLLDHPVVETNRGGKATFHGPGQLVGYAILDLRKSDRDLHAHLRWLEGVVIGLCREFGVAARRREGLTGVWVEDRKIASIGVGVRKWITMHGFALNVSLESLQGFGAIVPCGIDGVAMTCVEKETEEPVDVLAVAGVCRNALSPAEAGGFPAG